MSRSTRSLMVFVMLASACGGSATEFVDRDALLGESAAAVRLPGAVELAHVGADRITTFEGPQPAFDGYVLGTDADAEQVRSYYAGGLGRLGWVQESTRTRSTDELAAWWWCKPRINYRLAIKDQAKAFRPEFYRGQQFRTVFDATLNSREPGIACPYVAPPASSTGR